MANGSGTWEVGEVGVRKLGFALDAIGEFTEARAKHQSNTWSLCPLRANRGGSIIDLSANVVHNQMT
jgi:hypothetical protein